MLARQQSIDVMTITSVNGTMEDSGLKISLPDALATETGETIMVQNLRQKTTWKGWREMSFSSKATQFYVSLWTCDTVPVDVLRSTCGRQKIPVDVLVLNLHRSTIPCGRVPPIPVDVKNPCGRVYQNT